MDQHDSAMSILDQLKGINQDAGTFAAGLLSNDISKEDQIAFALLAVTELVINAVGATGVMDEHPRWWELDHLNLIRVRLLGMDASIVIEVWDSDPELAESISHRWNYFDPRSGGRVVWCELKFPRRSRAIDRTQEPPLPLPRRKRRPSPGPTRPIATERDPELLRRIIDGLMKLDDPPGGDDMRY
ncbi:MAG: ATP-binding protein [Pseudonocardiaceae bacterium]